MGEADIIIVGLHETICIEERAWGGIYSTGGDVQWGEDAETDSAGMRRMPAERDTRLIAITGSLLELRNPPVVVLRSPQRRQIRTLQEIMQHFLLQLNH